MKIIEAMKQIKELQRKAEDLREKVKECSADYDHETPKYEDQKSRVSGWIQAHGDIVKEILRLRIAIQRTNLQTSVEIEIGGKYITKNIAEWIHRRRDLAGEEISMWRGLTDKGLKEGYMQQSTGTAREVKIRRYYDPAQRDAAMDIFASEPGRIDARLEVINAITDLIEE